ncbi:MAG TPA: type VI secretion system membrane subunit TssM [Burkholderiales bacterium]|nr:type VI secretion system membrane subunit TssM [Burkholderiales bacterium]
MKRWLLGALALVAFSLVAWFVGDLVCIGAWRPFETPAGRAALIAAAGIAWAGLEFRRSRKARMENEKLLEVLASGGDSDSAARAAREIAVLHQRFEEAAAILKQARFKGPDGESRYVSELPWYVFIGAPGSGKTTALVNSGLRFPLREAAGASGDPALAGIGGTRNCDWWFTDEAVLLDTAGRYTTQESDLEADAAAWLGFLDLIKRFRPLRPLNGALVTLSISDLMLWNEDERRRYAWHVRARVAELYERLGVRFPVYLLVTKADLLAGFMEFFDEQGAEERARVWGATFGLSDGGFVLGTPGQRFAEEFSALERRLYGEMLERLQAEPDLQRRAAVYRFPQQFRSAGPLIEQFLDSAFIGVQGAPEPLLRGIYFTSGTQEGNPIDRVLGALTRSFNLEREGRPAPAGNLAPGGSGKSFFLTRLVREVIFPESGMAGSDERLERMRRRARQLAYGAMAVATVALFSVWTLSYLGNRAFVAAAQAKAGAARSELEKLGVPKAGDQEQLLRTLNALRDLPGGYGDRESGTAAAGGFGLSQEEKIGAQAMRAYQNALRDALMPRLAALDDAARLYADPKPDAEQIAAAAVRQWRLPNEDRADLAGHLRASLAEGMTLMHQTRDEAIIKNGRRKSAPAKTS